jgi:DNA-binding NarL/FixJ family response regulator
MTGQLVRVGVHSPQAIVREGIASLLDKHPDEVRVVPTPTATGDQDPDVVLYDVMSLLGGDTGALAFFVEMSGAKVLAVGRDLRPDLVGRAFASGVDGYISLGADEHELLAAVRAAVSGGEPDPEVDSRTAASGVHLNGAGVALSPRETEVLALIAAGLSNKQIAAHMFLSINSVKTYIRSAYRKIGVQSRSGAVSWAIRHGFAPNC